MWLMFADIPKGVPSEDSEAREIVDKKRAEQERELQALLNRLQREYRYQNLVPIISQHGTAQVHVCY